MILLTVDKINKSYSEKTLLKDITFGINEGDKIGIIGVNGTGKSTLLKIIAGVEEQDAGVIIKAKGVRIGYLSQNPIFEDDQTILAEVLKGVSAAQREAKEHECKTILTKLGFDDFDAKVNILSGGQRKRVAMAVALVNEVEILILDEPTNHIDNDMIEWLEKYLSKYKGAIIMVTHDRYFLDRVTNKIAEIQYGSLYMYQANYSKYLELKSEREDMVATNERKLKTLYRRELEWIQRGPRARGTKSQYRIDRFEDLKERRTEFQSNKIELNSVSSRLGKKIIDISHISKNYGDRTIIRDFEYIVLRNDRVGIIGHNGCGKSTLLKIIMGIENPDSGSINIGDTVKIGYFSQENEDMDTSLRVIDYIKGVSNNIATPDGMLSATQMLEKFLFTSDLQYTTIGRLSGGEKRRLYLLRILIDAPNILLLDEPTNDLDIQTLTILEDYIDSFEGAVIVVSHDRYFIDKVAEHLFVFKSDGEIQQYVGGYTDYADVIKQEEREYYNNIDASRVGKPKQYVKSKTEKIKFTYKEQREYEEIDDVIAQLEHRISETEKEIERQCSDYVLLQELAEKKDKLENELSEKMDRWVYLNSISEKINQITKE